MRGGQALKGGLGMRHWLDLAVLVCCQVGHKTSLSGRSQIASPCLAAGAAEDARGGLSPALHSRTNDALR